MKNNLQATILDRGSRQKKITFSHSMHDLLDKSVLDNFSVELRFCYSKLSRIEDEAIESIIKRPVEKLTLQKKKFHADWMSETIYKDFPLRERDKSVNYSYIDGHFYENIYNEAGQKTTSLCDAQFEIVPGKQNT